MERYISKETASNLTILGLYQVIGGAIGILFILWNTYNATPLNELTIFLYLFIAVFFSYSIFCGILCLKTKAIALRHSFINQTLQVIGISIFGYAFNYVAGLYLIIELDLKESISFGVNFGISTFDFRFNKEPDDVILNFNIIAIVLVIWIDRFIKKVKEEIEIRKTAEIGTEY